MMEEQQYKFPFQTLDEMVDIAQNMCEIVEERTLYLSENDGITHYPLEDKYAIQGVHTGKVYGITSSRYELCQHEEVAMSVATIINEQYKGLEVVGVIDIREPNIAIHMRFPDYIIDDPTNSQGIEVGAVVRHGVDGRSGLRGGARFSRVICTNGMELNALRNARFSLPHMGGFYQRMAKTISVLTQSVELRDRVSRLVESALEDEYEYFTREDLIHTLTGILGSPRLATYVVETGEANSRKFNRYDLYRDVTYVLEHKDFSPATREGYDRKAEKLLVGGVEIVRAPEIEA